MTQAEINNALKYALLALAAFAVGCLTALVPQLMDPTMPPLNWRLVAGAGITALITAYGGSMLPRAGSTEIAAQVDALKAQRVPRSEMVVLSQDDAAVALSPPPLPPLLTPEMLAQIAEVLVTPLTDELERRRAERVESRLRAAGDDPLISKLPAWLPPPPPPADSSFYTDQGHD